MCLVLVNYQTIYPTVSDVKQQNIQNNMKLDDVRSDAQEKYEIQNHLKKELSLTADPSNLITLIVVSMMYGGVSVAMRCSFPDSKSTRTVLAGVMYIPGIHLKF